MIIDSFLSVRCPNKGISALGTPRVTFPATKIGDTTHSEENCYLGKFIYYLSCVMRKPAFCICENRHSRRLAAQ